MRKNLYASRPLSKPGAGVGGLPVPGRPEVLEGRGHARLGEARDVCRIEELDVRYEVSGPGAAVAPALRGEGVERHADGAVAANPSRKPSLI